MHAIIVARALLTLHGCGGDMGKREVRGAGLMGSTMKLLW